MSNLSDRLVQLKNERGLLQKDIAQNINISLRAYQYYERGERNPDSETLIRLAEFFDISTDYLLGRSDRPYKNLKKENLILIKMY